MARHTAKSHKIRKVEILVIQILNCGQKGRIVVASRAFVYTNAIFALQNACWAVPNPLHSAPIRCRLRVFSKRFYLYKVELQDICTLQF